MTIIPGRSRLPAGVFRFLKYFLVFVIAVVPYLLLLNLILEDHDRRNYYLSSVPATLEFVSAPASPENPSDFLSTLRSLPWKDYQKLFQRKKARNVSDFVSQSEQLFFALEPYLVMPPTVPVNESCTPPPFQTPPRAPPCRRLAKPRKVAALFSHGLDADTLEILLQELNEVVDRFFLLEATTTYFIDTKKPLIWERLQRQPRFRPFLHKIVHFVKDDEAVGERRVSSKVSYDLQVNQEKILWLKFMFWNKVNGDLFGENDLLSFSDLDEVPSRDTVNYFKHCELPSDPVDVGIWFPHGNLSKAYLTDWPLMGGKGPYGFKYTFGAPTFWTLKRIQHEFEERVQRKKPLDLTFFRRRGLSNKFLFGGVHLNDYGYSPFLLAKLFTVIELGYKHINKETLLKLEQLDRLLNCSSTIDDAVPGCRRGSDKEVLEKVQSILATPPYRVLNRQISLAEFQRKYPVASQVVKLPWFYLCNRDRYPSWEDKLDNRLLPAG